MAATIVGEGAKTLVRILVDPTTEREAPEEGESAGSDSASEVPGPVAVGDVVVATDGHPFWVPELGAWVDAVGLAPGMWLQASSGTWVQVSAVEVASQAAKVHNLTVADLHTYHVAAGDLDLPNHNCQANGGKQVYLKPAGPGNGTNHMPQDASPSISHYSGPEMRTARGGHRQVYSTGAGVEPQARLSM